MPATSLQSQAEAKLAEAAEVEEEAKTQAASLELKLGRAIAKQKMSVPELIRKWDTNGDGDISKIELRQVVRNNLKIKADNKTIDALFDRLDVDGGGELDMKEMGVALKLFAKQVSTADADEAVEMAKAKALREDAASMRECAALTAEAEALQLRLGRLRDGFHDGDLASKLAAIVIKEAKAIGINDQKTKVSGAWYAAAAAAAEKRGETDKGGVLTAELFGRWARGFLKERAEGVEEAAFDAYYRELEQATGSAPLNLRKGVNKFWERVEELKEEVDALASSLEQKRALARKQQKTLVEMMMADLARRREKEEAAQAAIEEARAAKQARHAARAAEKAAKA